MVKEKKVIQFRSGKGPASAYANGTTATLADSSSLESFNLKLTVSLKDGKTLVGTYPYLPAMARLEFAVKLPNFLDFKLEAA